MTKPVKLSQNHKIFSHVIPMLIILMALNFIDRHFDAASKKESLWYYAHGQSAEGLQPDIRPLSHDNWHRVQLPHSIKKENTALWYRSHQVYERDTILQIFADDGAQLWVNQKRITSIGSNYFYIEGARDTQEILVRVLNNAVSGGLKKIVSHSPDLKFSFIQNAKFQNNRSLDKLNRRINEPKVFTNKSGTTIQFTAWGDPQGGWDTFQRIVNAISNPKYDFTIGLGDLTSNGSSAEDWSNFVQCLSQLTLDQPIYLIPGNHDYDGYYDDLKPQNYLSLVGNLSHPETYYLFSTHLAAFLVLDPNKNFPLGLDSTQIKWAKEVFDSSVWKYSKWRFILCHQVPYGQGWKGYHGESFLRAFLNQNAEKYKIDFVLGGHIHDYERLSKKYGSQNVHFLISGGAGGNLESGENDDIHDMDKIIKKHHYLSFKMTEESVEIKCNDLNQNILDQYKVNRK